MPPISNPNLADLGPSDSSAFPEINPAVQRHVTEIDLSLSLSFGFNFRPDCSQQRGSFAIHDTGAAVIVSREIRL